MMCDEGKANINSASNGSTNQSAELLTVSIPKSANVGSVEETLDKFFREVGPVRADIELDMSKCTFIEAGTLIFLIALMAAQQEEDLSMQLRLPQSKEVRDFLRVWEFQQAVKDALGLSLRDIVCEEDHKYFGENEGSPENLRYTGPIVDTGAGRERLPSGVFYGVKTIFPGYTASHRLLVEEQSTQWKEQHIISVLTRHLGSSGTRVSSHIVFEAIMNALRHPGATRITTTSFFDRRYRRGKKGKGYFTVVFWDDGESVIDTLMASVIQGKKIRVVDVPRLYADYELIVEDETGHKLPSQVVRSDFLPKPDTPEELSLLAATFPGVTRDVTGKGHHVHPDVLRDDEVFGMPGMGLHVLTNTTVDVFGGMISLRTKNYFMNIRASSARMGSGTGTRYRAKVKRYGNWVPRFLGNMLTVRLPLVG